MIKDKIDVNNACLRSTRTNDLTCIRYQSTRHDDDETNVHINSRMSHSARPARQEQAADCHLDQELRDRTTTVCLRCTGLVEALGPDVDFVTRCLLTLFLPKNQRWFRDTLVPFLQSSSGRFSLVHIAMTTNVHCMTLVPMTKLKQFQCPDIDALSAAYERRVEIPLMVAASSKVRKCGACSHTHVFLLRFGGRCDGQQGPEAQVMDVLGRLHLPTVKHTPLYREKPIDLPVHERACSNPGCPLTASFECLCDKQKHTLMDTALVVAKTTMLLVTIVTSRRNEALSNWHRSLLRTNPSTSPYDFLVNQVFSCTVETP